MRYEIRVEGVIESQWVEWFGGLTITHVENAETLLMGDLRGQRDLQQVLERIRVLGLNLISVRRID